MKMHKGDVMVTLTFVKHSPECNVVQIWFERSLLPVVGNPFSHKHDISSVNSVADEF